MRQLLEEQNRRIEALESSGRRRAERIWELTRQRDDFAEALRSVRYSCKTISQASLAAQEVLEKYAPRKQD